VARHQWHYIEVSFDEPGEDTTYRAHVIWADGADEAMTMARASTLAAHPYADNIELFTCRPVDTDKALDIRDQIRNGSWTGWKETA